MLPTVNTVQIQEDEALSEMEIVLSENAQAILEKRYLRKGNEG